MLEAGTPIDSHVWPLSRVDLPNITGGTAETRTGETDLKGMRTDAIILVAS